MTTIWKTNKALDIALSMFLIGTIVITFASSIPITFTLQCVIALVGVSIDIIAIIILWRN